MISLEEFGEKVVNLVKEEMGELVIHSGIKRKNNNIMLRSIDIAFNSKSALCIYLDKYYIDYCQNNTTIDEVVQDIISTYRKEEKKGMINDLDFRNFMEYDNVKDRIYFKLINTEKNKNLLEEVPSADFLNLSIVYYIGIKNTEDVALSTIIKNEVLDFWGINWQELHDVALKNTKEKQGSKLMTMEKILMEILSEDETQVGDKAELFDEAEIMCEGTNMYVLTNQYKMYGASALLYTDKLKELSGKMESDLYILPSSIHEVILIPENLVAHDVDTMLEMVRCINENKVPNDEILADSIYMYKRHEDEIMLVA